jgi:protein TonB
MEDNGVGKRSFHRIIACLAAMVLTGGVSPVFAQQHGRTPRFGDFGTVSAAQVIPNSAQPGKYPTLAARRHEEGTVKLALTVTPEGKLKYAAVLKSSGSAALDAGAILAVYGWRFIPAQNRGLAVEGHTEISFDFHIEDADDSETENPVPPLPPRDRIAVMDDALAAQGVTPPMRRPDDRTIGAVGQGKVGLELVLGTDGQVDDVLVTQSSGDPRLDAAAELSAANWRYTPAKKAGQPIFVRLPVVVNFESGTQ